MTGTSPADIANLETCKEGDDAIPSCRDTSKAVLDMAEEMGLGSDMADTFEAACGTVAEEFECSVVNFMDIGMARYERKI